MNISHFRLILFNLKIFREIVTTLSYFKSNSTRPLHCTTDHELVLAYMNYADLVARNATKTRNSQL